MKCHSEEDKTEHRKIAKLIRWQCLIKGIAGFSREISVAEVIDKKLQGGKFHLRNILLPQIVFFDKYFLKF